MRNAALDPRQLVERHLRVFDVFVRGSILAHLLHQAFRRRDRIADFVREGRGQLIQRRLLLGPQLLFLLQDFALNFARDRRLKNAI